MPKRHEPRLKRTPKRTGQAISNNRLLPPLRCTERQPRAALASPDTAIVTTMPSNAQRAP
jgi:hypothetical protein